MYWALLSIFLGGMGRVMLKKALGFKVSVTLNDFWRQVPTFLIFGGYFAYIGGIYVDWMLLGAITGCVLLFALGRISSNYVFKHEKISSVIPYENFGRVLTIILGFLLFSDISLTSFLISLATVVVIFLASVDFKTLKISRAILIFLMAQTFFGIGNTLMGYAILQISALDYFTWYAIISTVLGLLTSVILKDFVHEKGEGEMENENQKLGWTYYRIVFTSGIFGWFAWFISLVVVQELGLSISILLSFLSMIINFILLFIFLGDKPAKKDLFLSVFVSILVALGFYYR